MSGAANNAYLYGANDGNPASVTVGGNLGTQLYYDKIVNIGRLVLRSGKVTRLPDIKASMVMVYSPSTNSKVWYAGYDTDAPQVDVGIPLLPGTSVNLYCTDANQISFIPETDGNQIYVIAFAVGTNTPITPSDPSAYDSTAPTLSPLQPATNAATNVSNVSPIIIACSKMLDPTTVNSTNITISPSITGTISEDSANPQNIIIYPISPLALSTTYTITIPTTGIADNLGFHLASTYTQTFTTAATSGPPDTTPPTVITSDPLPNQTSVDVTTLPTITFSEAILLSSVNQYNVIAYVTDNNQQILNLNFSLSQDMQTLIIQNMPLDQSTNYQISVLDGPGAITDLSGNYLTAQYLIPFATAAPPGNTIYSVSGNTYDTLQANNAYLETCIYLYNSRSLLIGQTPTKFTFILKRVGSPPGNIDFYWERVDSYGDWQDFKHLGYIAASSISTTQDYLVTIDYSANTIPFQHKDLISVRYTAGGNSSNYILVRTSNYDVFDGSNTCSLKTDYNYYDNIYTSSDLAGTITVI